MEDAIKLFFSPIFASSMLLNYPFRTMLAFCYPRWIEKLKETKRRLNIWYIPTVITTVPYCITLIPAYIFLKIQDEVIYISNTIFKKNKNE